ncbi:hypothetical protein F8388_016061 [Cannabis sativa]|uniref:DUF4283 domain-containing protein n=1 Tax=Cannabis sativa TaxID=3483 RepID=A0A7J6FXK6_CANSA|nr:hypothetical protein F8388_016061 [Cannabis sativa]KAF4402502.1 hypothetical protein G4B88_012287 [Cannabis sativa]
MTRMGEFWSKKCRFEVTVSEMHSELYLPTLGCAGDKLRLMEGEPWHYNNFLIVLHSLTVLHNVSKEDLNKVQIRVQVHPLPFLSKSRALACKIGEKMDTTDSQPQPILSNKEGLVFDLKKMWLSDAECAEIISNNWLLQPESDISSNLQSNLQNVAENLQSWHS